MTEKDNLESVQWWTAKRRVALVMTILRDETIANEAAHKHGLTVARVEDWQEKFLTGVENSLRSMLRE